MIVCFIFFFLWACFILSVCSFMLYTGIREDNLGVHAKWGVWTPDKEEEIQNWEYTREGNRRELGASCSSGLAYCLQVLGMIIRGIHCCRGVWRKEEGKACKCGRTGKIYKSEIAILILMFKRRKRKKKLRYIEEHAREYNPGCPRWFQCLNGVVGIIKIINK